LELLRIAAIGSWVVGLSIAVIAVVALIRAIRNVPARFRALGFVYLGMFVGMVGGVLYLLALIGEDQLPLWAGVVPVLIIGFTAIRMRLAVSRAFAEASRSAAGDIRQH